VPEPELYKFLQGLSSACSFLEKKGIHHGALHLESVYFDEEYLLYRIQDVSPFRVKAPNLFKNPYPAPELQQNVSANKYKVDVFSLGYISSFNSRIVILSMMLLKDCGNLFVQGVLD
jgi:serine/threonine protein kinase